jgi:hypothetical protein
VTEKSADGRAQAMEDAKLLIQLTQLSGVGAQKKRSKT